jgi:hypothetical protein
LIHILKILCILNHNIGEFNVKIRHYQPTLDMKPLARLTISFKFGELPKRLADLASLVCHPVTKPVRSSNTGAPTIACREAANLAAAPLSGQGPYRIGEDGRLYFAAKSEREDQLIRFLPHCEWFPDTIAGVSLWN